MNSTERNRVGDKDGEKGCVGGGGNDRARAFLSLNNPDQIWCEISK